MLLGLSVRRYYNPTILGRGGFLCTWFWPRIFLNRKRTAIALLKVRFEVNNCSDAAEDPTEGVPGAPPFPVGPAREYLPSVVIKDSFGATCQHKA